MIDDPPRCSWPGSDPLYVAYHDEEWGVPVYDDKALYAKLVLDGFQAGLAWITILRKRHHFYAAFDGLDPSLVARYDEGKVEALLSDAGIVRHRGKIEAAIQNAQAWEQIMARGEGSFAKLLWSFVGGHMKINDFSTLADAPPKTPESEAMSKALKKLGFRFCGPTIVYAFMQAVGMVNDHLTSCFRHSECCELERARV